MSKKKKGKWITFWVWVFTILVIAVSCIHSQIFFFWCFFGGFFVGFFLGGGLVVVVCLVFFFKIMSVIRSSLLTNLSKPANKRGSPTSTMNED